jgi:hypothetical protein
VTGAACCERDVLATPSLNEAAPESNTLDVIAPKRMLPSAEFALAIAVPVDGEGSTGKNSFQPLLRVRTRSLELPCNK